MWRWTCSIFTECSHYLISTYSKMSKHKLPFCFVDYWSMALRLDDCSILAAHALFGLLVLGFANADRRHVLQLQGMSLIVCSIFLSVVSSWVLLLPNTELGCHGRSFWAQWLVHAYVTACMAESKSSVQFSSTSRWYLSISGKPPHLLGVSTMLPLKQFQCWSDWWWALPLSMPLSSRRSMVWCPC